MNFSKFNQSDWEFFSGAECFDCGGAPLIAPCKVDGEDAMIIVDRNGATAYWMVRNDFSCEAHLNILIDYQEEAGALIKNLSAELSSHGLTLLGFAVKLDV
ncbi:MAG: hypothetical protein ACYSWO_30455 [Planctomycetota bacterium]|jgi:hypothetical protein